MLDIKHQDQWFAYAYGEGSMSYHQGGRGSVFANIGDPSPRIIPDLSADPTLDSISITMPAHVVGPEPNSYFCSYHEGKWIFTIHNTNGSISVINTHGGGIGNG